MVDPLDDLNEGELFNLFQAAALAVRHKEGLISPKEKESLDRWLAESKDHREWFDAFMSEDEIFAPKFEIFKELSAGSGEAFQKVCEHLGIEPQVEQVTRVRRRRPLFGIVVMAVAAVFFAALLYRYSKIWSNRNKQEVAVVTNGDVAPGGNHAVLTLANGQQIQLDKVAVGALPAQGTYAPRKPGDSALVYEKGGDPVGMNTLTTPRGGQYSIILPDGSKVWLNASSSLCYPISFTGAKERQVTLEGEAYFDIAKNTSQPFIVKTGGGSSVRVLGTQFDVMAYADEEDLETTLVEGAVKVNASNTTTKTLRPGEQARVSSVTGDLRVASDVNLKEVMAWHLGQFKFVNRDLPYIMRQITRWYNVPVSYEGQVSQGHFNGTITRFANVSRVLRILEETGAVHFKIKQDKIVVLP